MNPLRLIDGPVDDPFQESLYLHVFGDLPNVFQYRDVILKIEIILKHIALEKVRIQCALCHFNDKGLVCGLVP